ncbi:MAG: threonine ammonia-lyase [Dehalococcoidia bacterium]|nr:threonine ammonia-lyase [Dehalococcoidia bacterium]
MEDGTVSFDDIAAAQVGLAGHVRETPVWPFRVSSPGLDTDLLLKCEHMQVTGSFKIRGALNFVHNLDDASAQRGLVAMSAGNHAQGVALAARSRGASATIVVPATAPLAKINATRALGARVVIHGASLEEARAEAFAIADREGRIFVPPFDDDAVIAGQGTVGLELVRQAPDVNEVLVPAGGGGLLAGVALALKHLRPGIRVIGVQSAAMDGIARSLAAGKPVAVGATRTIADGVAVSGPSERTFALIQRYVDEVVTVPDEAIAQAILALVERAKFVVEGAGALGIAAVMSGRYRPKGKALAVISGGNIDINLLGSMVRRGLVEAGRYQHLAVEVSDTPGELALVSSVIAEVGGNILEVDHNREAPGMPVGVAVLELLLEVNGAEQFSDILEALRERGLRGVPGSPARLATESARRRHESR